VQIKECLFSDHEIALLKITDSDDHMYDQNYFTVLKKLIIMDDAINIGAFKVFNYKKSLRFSILFAESPGEETIGWLTNEIKRYITDANKCGVMLWYSQINGFSNILIDRLAHSNPYRFVRYCIKRDDISLHINMKGLEKRQCTEDMIDACIDVMEDLFTPFPDSPGSFRQDKERIRTEFLHDAGGTELFFIDGDLVGFCGHVSGHITEVCVKRAFQGIGYGEVIVRSVLRSVYKMGYDASLTTGSYNMRAIKLYEKAGFKRICESIRINLL